MAKGKYRKRRSAKSAQVIFLAGAIVTAECLGHEEKKHIENRQYGEIPGLVGQAWNIAAASTATITKVSPFIFPEQFT
jgi:hypothetical protein